MYWLKSSLRLKTLQLIILDKNSNKKEDFEKRNAQIQVRNNEKKF